MKSLRFLIVKEFKQMWRNRILPVVIVLIPLGLMNMIPRIATQEIKGLTFVVVDNDHSTLSQRLIHKIDASAYLALAAVAGSHDEAMRQVEQGKADIIVEIPLNYEHGMLMGQPQDLGISANATNGMKGSMAANYVTMIAQAHTLDILEEMGATIAAPSIHAMFMFNTHLDYRLYMVPAVFGLMLVLIVGFLPALNIVLEKEHGTIEQINVTPVKKMEFIIAKLVPYWVVGLFMSFLAMGAARGLYGFVPVGSIGTYLAFVSIFCLLISAVGLIISNYSSTMQQAALTMFFFLVIFILMSGMLTPIRSMPQWAQMLTILNPLRHMIEALRGIYIKGSVLADLRQQFFCLAAFAVFFSLWATASYKKNE